MAYFLSSLFIIFSISSVAFSETSTNTIQTFIVSVENAVKPVQYLDVDEWYNSILRNLNSFNSLASIGHIYKTVFEGFSAKLTPQQAQELKNRPEIIGLFRQHIYQLHTTRSPEFLGLLRTGVGSSQSTESEYGNNVIIGIIDTGVWPELRSFNDEDLGPIPPQWKGVCEGGEGFPKTLCNKKLIGVRYFRSGDVYDQDDANTARDTVGHGSHTASTAAGRAVSNASFLGTYAKGTAEGIAPKARLAIYKVCWAHRGCEGSDVLAAFDKAVEDNVNVISVSLGYPSAMPLIEDESAIGAFGAMEKGITISISAGNSGPETASVSSIAPWLITVGASTIDRKFPADLLLENGGSISGISLFNGIVIPENEYWPLIYGRNASLDHSEESAYCLPNFLDEKLVRGKIVVCESGMMSDPELGSLVSELGGIGVVVANSEPGVLVSFPYLNPGLTIDQTSRKLLIDYMSRTPNPRAMMMFRGTQVGLKPAPVVSFFSSRGPNPISSYVMKPDVIAPGVDILAGWPTTSPPSRLPEDKRVTEFNILSGTSMSCPHVSGIAAILKSIHNDWSPAMIRSAIMTTAYTYDQDGNPLLEDNSGISTPWDMGAGHVDPLKAIDPGLVYDITYDEYVEFLCASNMSGKDLKIITRRSVECKNNNNPWDLNYPAISVAFDSSNIKDIVVKRTLTNVGDENSTYVAKVNDPMGVSVTVDPPNLVFKSKGEKLSYTLRFEIDKQLMKPPAFGQLIWTDGKHHVTSPLIVAWL